MRKGGPKTPPIFMTKRRKKEDLRAVAYLLGSIVAYIGINYIGLLICMILYWWIRT